MIVLWVDQIQSSNIECSVCSVQAVKYEMGKNNKNIGVRLRSGINSNQFNHI